MKVHGISKKERKIILFEKLEDGTSKIYSKDLKQKTLSKEEFDNIRSNPITSEYLLIKRNMNNALMKNLSLRKQYKLFIKEAKLLKKITKGEINLFKTGRPTTTILEYFSRFNPQEPEPIELYEFEIFEKCSNSALIFADKYEGEGYRYDFVSQFPYLMQNTGFQVPLTKGTLTTISSEEFAKMKYFKFGIYHVQIINSNKKLLIQNHANWYTHTDLNRAKELGYSMIIIQDEQPNALLYDKFINGSKLFGPIIRNLYKFKDEGFKLMKKYINCFWGALCQTNVLTLTLTPNNKSINHDKWNIRNFKPCDNGNCIVDLVNRDKPYETNFARIKPFIMAKSRYMLSKVIEQNINKVVWAHTDGVILTEPISEDTKIGSNIGDLKFDGSNVCKIKNATSFKFDDDDEPDLFAEMKTQKKLAKKLYS